VVINAKAWLLHNSVVIDKKGVVIHILAWLLTQKRGYYQTAWLLARQCGYEHDSVVINAKAWLLHNSMVSDKEAWLLTFYDGY
jgi:hypothetical protein